MHYIYKMKGTCASEVCFDMEEGKVSAVEFKGGCNGNLKAISKLCEGESAEKLVDILAGNTCGFRKTSCADQFAIALAEAICKENEEQNN